MVGGKMKSSQAWVLYFIGGDPPQSDVGVDVDQADSALAIGRDSRRVTYHVKM